MISAQIALHSVQLPLYIKLLVVAISHMYSVATFVVNMIVSEN